MKAHDNLRRAEARSSDRRTGAAMEADEAADRSLLGEGRYANYFEVGHNLFEFVLDFGQAGQENEPIRIYLRIITSPEGAATLSRLLGEALGKYRQTFGPIRGDESA